MERDVNIPCISVFFHLGGVGSREFGFTGYAGCQYIDVSYVWLLILMGSVGDVQKMVCVGRETIIVWLEKGGERLLFSVRRNIFNNGYLFIYQLYWLYMFITSSPAPL